MQAIILGSQSPRRKELLEKAGFKFEVVLPQVDEVIPEHIAAFDAPEYLAKIKAENVLAQLTDADKIVITSDTLVICDHKIFGKPNDINEAKTMLQALSNKVHHVVTGVCIASANQIITHTSKVEVHFKALAEEEINYYTENYQVLDKAGAYAIQEWIGIIGIEKIVGDYYTVMGLPINWLYNELKLRFNIKPF